MRFIDGCWTSRNKNRLSWSNPRRRAPGLSALCGALKTILACLLPFVATAAALAADIQPSVESLNAPPGPGGSFLRMLGALIFVIALFLFGVWFFQNHTRFLSKSGKTARLQILEGRALGNRQAVYVVGYDRQRWLVGATPTTISLIGTLPEASEDSAPVTPAPPHFMSVLQQVFNRKP